MSEEIPEVASRASGGRIASGFSVLGIAAFALIGPFTLEQATAESILFAILLFTPILGLLLALIYFEIRRRPYSLNLMHLVALLIFVALAPMMQVAWGAYPLVMMNDIVIGNLLLANFGCLIWLGAYAVSYYITETRSKRRSTPLDRILQTPISSGGAWLMLLTAPLALGWLWAIGLGGAVTRDSAEAVLFQLDLPLQLFTGTYVRQYPYVALATAIVVLRRERRWLLLPAIVVIGLATIYINNPMAAARYWTVAILLGLIAPIALERRRTGSILLLISIAGLVIMPALDLGRRLESVDDVLTEAQFLELPSPAVYLAENGDVASFAIHSLGFEWVDRFGHTWGAQLASALVLFWVPRSWWETKPISSGSQIVGDLGFDFTVLSAPIMTDAYLDFGWIGIMLFAALVGFVLARIDTNYFQDSGNARVIDTFYPFLVGMMLFVTRGSLMSAFPFTATFFFCAAPLLALAIAKSAFKKRPAYQDPPSV